MAPFLRLTETRCLSYRLDTLCRGWLSSCREREASPPRLVATPVQSLECPASATVLPELGCLRELRELTVIYDVSVGAGR
jgi:hypothetical protein